MERNAHNNDSGKENLRVLRRRRSNGAHARPCWLHLLEADQGRWRLKIKKAKIWKIPLASYGPSEIPINIATAAFAAHEAVEHVNNMRGRNLLTSQKKLSHAEHVAETEDEANSIAREIVSKRFGWTIKFGDEIHRDTLKKNGRD